jgi:hypothetical protein
MLSFAFSHLPQSGFLLGDGAELWPGADYIIETY